jgi:YD repeat-containing protein
MKKSVDGFTILARQAILNLSHLSRLLKQKTISIRVIRLVSVFLITALLSPVFLFSPTWKSQAQTNIPIAQPILISAPLEPYTNSIATNPTIVIPALDAITEGISNSYSAATDFIKGPNLPEGLGAATPSPTLTERLGGFFTPRNVTPDSKIITKNASTLPKSTSGLLLPACSSVAFDFDGDCKSDIGRWQSSSFQYKILNSSSSTYTSLNLGSSSSKIAPADFDGDGKFDMAVFSSGSWTVRKSSTNTDWSVSWGTTGDLPVAADYDGDGKADFAVYRPSTHTFWVLTSTSNYASYTSTTLGSSGDLVVPGDFDGDHKADCAVFRPSNGHWYFQPCSGGSVTEVAWGVSTDIPSPGDFDGDGLTDITVFRPSTGTWYILKSTGGSPNYLQTNWGNYGDQPVPADYDGDGKTDLAIYRPTTGVWWISNSSGSPGYTTQNLGTSADIPVASAYLKQSGAELYPDQLTPVRLAPINGTGGTNYYSRNIGWSTELVGLPGRSRLDLNFGMGYNSLIWTKVGSTMAFDMDHSNLAPGFNFGFPRIEPAYVSSQTALLSYLMVSPSGGRTEFRQTAASDVYETADSGFAQIKVNNPGTSTSPTAIEDLTLTVTGTHGSQMSYAWISDSYHCTKIKDSNGNYIDISYNGDGQLTSVTDTLGRTVTINYDSSNRVSSITQNWLTSNGSSSTTTHTWVSFTYTTKTVSTSFDTSLSVYGPANTTSLSVLQKVTYADGSYTKFDYNGYGQVYKISSYAPNDGLLNYTWRDIESPLSNQTDCPRFTQTKSYAANFNNGSEVTINNSFSTGQSYTPPGGSSTTGTKIEIKGPDSVGTADALVTKIFSASSGWAEALPVLTEDYATEGSTLTKKRSVWTNYTQEDTGLAYIKNPRVTETKISDDANTKRIKLYYLMQTGSTTVTQYGLVSKAEIYDSDQSTVLKTQTASYNTSSNYLSRRIIGLPLEADLYEGTDTSGTLVSKMTYGYDENGYAGTGQSVSATKHDSTNYGTGFNYRGNQTSTTRWDVTNPTSSASAVSSLVKYNIAGSPISQTDSLNHTVNFSYTDAWYDTDSRSATYAYPTVITNAGGFSSTVKYRYDFGANVWARSPTPAGTGNTYGLTSSRTFDDTTGQITKEKIENSISGAYTRYVYPSDGASLNTYSTITDIGNDGIDSSDEVLTETLFDGAGRPRKTRTENTGSSGGYTGKMVEYNILGQVKRESVPTEINSSWNPAGDDYRGMSGSDYIWLWTSREYDWKGRVTRTVNTDGTDQLISYDGCGCAGNQVTTIKGEVTTAIDVSGTQQTTKRRTQKIYADILGRTIKTELWDLDGGGSTPYSTMVKVYNGRDQVTQTTRYVGDASSSNVHQDTIFNYDGHGRLSSKHRPEQQNSNGNAYTTYTYNANDSLQSVVDARGASTNYTYNDPRGLLTNVTYTGSNIPATSSLTFTYDNMGNRTSMHDGLGTVSYGYDELSRLKFETRTFNDNLTDTTVPEDGFKLEYNYTPGGQLKSYKDPYNREFQFTFDKIGRNTAVTGTTAYAGITNYSSNQQYRAFGLLKQISYGNQTTATMTYNNRLQPSSYRLNDATQTLFGKDYYYTTTGNNDNDGLLKRSVHYDNTMTTTEQAKRNQLNTYDALGRIAKSETGEGGLTPFGNYRNGPFQQTYTYDAYGNMTAKNDRDFGAYVTGCSGCPRTISYYETIANNRTQNSSYYSADGASQYISNYQYDNDGRLISRNGDTVQFDATGKMVVFDNTGNAMDDYYNYDGEGDLLKWSQTGYAPQTTYYVKSSVFKANVLELNSAGAMSKEFVFSATGSKISYLKDNDVVWLHEEPSGKERYEIKQDRTANSKQTYDPTGAATSNNDGYVGGTPCPPSSCYSNENNAVMQQVNRGFDGLERLTQWRNAQWLQSNQFEILRIGLAGIWKIEAGKNDPPVPKGYHPLKDPNPNNPDDDDKPIHAVGFGTEDKIGFEFFFVGSVTENFGDEPNDCQISVEDFVGFVKDADLALNGDNGIQAGSDQYLGWRSLVYAYFLSKDIADTHLYRVNGFKDELIKDGQRGQVYQHIYATAGATLANDGVALPFGYPAKPSSPWFETGAQLAKRQRDEDVLQSKNGRPGDDNGLEAATEVRDDDAGINIGNVIRDFRRLDSNDYEKLRKDIFGILCK